MTGARSAAALLCAVLAAGTASALASDRGGAVGRVADTVALARSIGPALAVPGATLEGLGACAAVADALEECRSTDACAASLRALYASLETDVPDRDVFTQRKADQLASATADATLGLAAAAGCGEGTPSTRIAARVVVAPDRHTLYIRPTVALRPGRRFALIIDGLTDEMRPGVRASAVPRSGDSGLGLVLPEGSFSEPIERALRDGTVDHGGTAGAFARRLERQASARNHVSSVAGLQVRWPRPLTAADLERLRISFVPVDEAPPGSVVATFETLDGRRGLTAYRERLASLRCPDESAQLLDVTDVLGPDAVHVGLLARGTYLSLEIRGDEVSRLPYLLALPEDLSPDTPIVLGVDGFTGNASRLLRSHADELARRGIGLLAIDLPEHGERGEGGAAFLDVLDPTAVRVNLRQAVVDVMAAVRALRDCGLRLPGRDPLRRVAVPYLGYSLGAMVGVIARAVEPGLGTTVLFAPAGDVPGWLMLKVVPHLTERPYVSCLGGPDHGRSCFPEGRCASPGICGADPFVHWLTALLPLPYGLAIAGADPLEYARLRTGPASTAPLLLLTGGRDATLHVQLQDRLSDAYDMRPVGPRAWRGPRSVRLHWPQLGHELVDVPEVRAAAYDFLQSGGRRPSTSSPPSLVDRATTGG